MAGPKEFELAWAPFYCFGEPVCVFLVSSGTLSSTRPPLPKVKETPFPTSLFLDDTPENERLVAIVNQLIHLGLPSKASMCENDLYLLFGAPTWTDDMMTEESTTKGQDEKTKNMETALKKEMCKSQIILSNHVRSTRIPCAKESRSAMYDKMKRLRIILEKHGIYYENPTCRSQVKNLF